MLIQITKILKLKTPYDKIVDQLQNSTMQSQIFFFCLLQFEFLHFVDGENLQKHRHSQVYKVI